MPLDYSNPHIIKFLTENFEKAEEKRMLWFLKNQENLEKLASFPENYKGLRTLEVKKVPLSMLMPSMAVQHANSSNNRRKRALRDGVIQGVAQFAEQRKPKGQPIDEPEPLMKPIDFDVQSILYRALPSGGRRRYLDKRKREIPENKYNFCETSTNVYGWRLNDSKLCRQPAKYGRYFVFKHDINSRSGPQPDPAYYQKPPNEPYSKCFG